jgi:hypothetical protein
LTRRDVGVVGRLEMAGVVPVQISDRQRDRQEQQPEGNGDRMPSEPTLPSFVARFTARWTEIRLGLEARFRDPPCG